MCVVGPSASSTASHLPSGESTGCIRSQLDNCDPRDASQLLRCSILRIRDQHFHVRQSIERGQIQHKVKFSVDVHRGSLTVLAHEQIGAPLAKVFSMRNPFWLVGEK